jgi:hypothetical protein
MQLDEGTLGAYLDGELSPPEVVEVQQALADSSEAREILARLQQERSTTTLSMGHLAPSAEDSPAAAAAWQQLQRHPDFGRSQEPTTTGRSEAVEATIKQPLLSRYRTAITATAIVAVTVASLGFAPVRALAGDFLQLFRVEKIQVVEIDQEHLRTLGQDPRFQGLMERLEPQIQQLETVKPQSADSTSEAATMVGFQVSEIGHLPPDVGVRTNIDVHPQSVLNLDLDRQLLEALFEAADIEVTLPASLDTQPLIVTQPNTVVQKWRSGDKHTLSLIQMDTPRIEAPEDLDVKALSIAGLQLLGLSEPEARQLGETIDWANTMVLPIPRDARMQVQQVSVNGADGFLFSSSEEETHDSALMWTHDGYSFFLRGGYSAEELLATAASIE